MTLTLHYAPKAISLASVIVLEELGLSYELVRVDFSKVEQRSQAYLKRNPLGRVPSLETPEGTLTETIALLVYLAERKPEAGLLPPDPFGRAQALSFASYLASTVHVAHAHRMRGTRWVDASETEAIAAMQRKVPEAVLDAFLLVERHWLAETKPWVLGERFSVCDAYLFTVAQWLEADGVDTTQLPRVLAHRERVHARPATARALSLTA
jgi:glutathione S-transferase